MVWLSAIVALIVGVNFVLAWRESRILLDAVADRNRDATCEMVRALGAVYLHQFMSEHGKLLRKPPLR